MAEEKAPYAMYAGSAEQETIVQAPSHQAGEVVMEERRFSTWTALGLGHSITNSAMGVLLVYASSGPYGGAPLFLWGWLAMLFVGVCVAISLGELSSMLPHAGGQYFWTSKLAPEEWKRLLSYVTAVFSWAGAVCTTASATLAAAQLFFDMYASTHPDFVYEIWMGFVAYVAITLILFGVNVYERLLPWMGKSMLTFTITSLFVIFVCLLAPAGEYSSADAFFLRLRNVSSWATAVAFFIGLNGPNWCFSCLDGVCHLADELPDPARSIPKALLCTVAVGGSTGLLIIIAIFLRATDLNTEPTISQLFLDVVGHRSAALGLQSLVLISTCGAIVGCHTWQCRLTWAMSRDRGWPWAKYQSRLAPSPWQTPIYAHIFNTVVVVLLGCLYLASAAAFSSMVSAGILSQYISYSIPILCLLWSGRHTQRHGPFWVGGLGYASNIVVLVWTVISLAFYSLPYDLPVTASQMNYVSLVLVLILLYAVGYYFIWARKTFQPPDWYRT